MYDIMECFYEIWFRCLEILDHIEWTFFGTVGTSKLGEFVWRTARCTMKGFYCLIWLGKMRHRLIVNSHHYVQILICHRINWNCTRCECAFWIECVDLKCGPMDIISVIFLYIIWVVIIFLRFSLDTTYKENSFQ